MRQVDYLVVHTAGAYNARSSKVVHQTAADIDAYHREHNGWRMIGYHRFVEQDGTIMHGRRDDEIGAHAVGFNAHSLGICVSGHGDYEAFNPQQMSALILQLTRWCRDYHLPATRVLGHRETDEHGGPPVYKTCPGKLVDMSEIRRLVATRLDNFG